MPKKAKELSATEIRRINKPGRHAVGFIAGLLLVVKELGSKSWILRTLVGGRRRSIGLGGYPEVSLAEARERAREIKKAIRQGVDPIQERRARLRNLARYQMTFAEAVRLCHAKKSQEFRNPKHSRQWLTTLETYANPVIGNIPVAEIDLPHILKILEPLWQEKTETATRLRQRIENVLVWATVAGHRSGDNPARWKGHLDAVLPKPNKLKTVKHHPAIPWKEIGGFMQDLRIRDGMGARALEFILLTAARSGEARKATWDEIDLEGKVWTVPSERMKNGKEHQVPLSDQAVNLLEKLPKQTEAPFVFFAPRGGNLSDMSISAVCRRMGVDAVPHGFRSTFRDWCAECTNYPREVAEMALAHTIPSAVEAAYRRGDLFRKRKAMMQAWADYCDKPQTSTRAIPLKRKEAQHGG
jgi:integrase